MMHLELERAGGRALRQQMVRRLGVMDLRSMGLGVMDLRSMGIAVFSGEVIPLCRRLGSRVAALGA
jgi:hypothetical protein